nr:hypothetical protein [Tanacetum cinerariifolium]
MLNTTKDLSETSLTRTPKRTARISVLSCCLINLTSFNESSLVRNFLPPSDYNVAPLYTPLESPPRLPLAPQDTSPIITTSKVTPSPLTNPTPIPTQPSKQTPPQVTNLEPLELIFTTPPTSPHPYFNNLEDLPSILTNLPHLLSFESINHLVSQPSPLTDIMDVEPPLPPIPPHFPPPHTFLPSTNQCGSMVLHHHLSITNIFMRIARTQTIAYELHDEMRFILNHILERCNAMTHQNTP